MKWDCNSPFHNPYSHYLGNNQQHLWIEYTKGLYHIFSEVVRLQPNLQMMLCSAGGARSDYGSMRYFHEFWASDNTTPLSRVYIQWGYSHIFPSKTVGAHVTHMGNQPFKFAFDVAMSGCLGMDADPTKMNEEEKKITKRSVELYKTRLRNTVQFGDLYRLLSPYETSRASLIYVEPEKKAKAVLFVYQVRDARGRLCGAPGRAGCRKAIPGGGSEYRFAGENRLPGKREDDFGRRIDETGIDIFMQKKV